MSKDELTPEEIEALSGPGTPPTGPSASNVDRAANTPTTEPMCSLDALHGQAADRFAEALAAVLRSPAKVRFSGLQNQARGQCTVKKTANPCRHVFKISPFDGELALDIAPSIVQPMIARLLGGNPCRSTRIQRPLTEIEQRLTVRIAELLLTQWCEAWAGQFDLEIQAAHMENSLPQSGGFPAGKPAVIARFEIELDGLSGQIDLCIPQSLVEWLGERLATMDKSADGNEEPSKQCADKIDRALQNSLIEFHVELARTRLAAGELLDLEVGDVITTEQSIDEPLTVDVDGHVQFHVKPGTHEGRKAVQIDRRLDLPS